MTSNHFTLLPEDTRHVGTRGLIACAGSFIAFLGFWAVNHYAQVDQDGIGHFYDAVVLDMVQRWLEASMLACVVLGALSWRARATQDPAPWLSAAITVILSVAYTLLAVAYGFYTSPLSLLIMGILAFGLVFFDRRAVLLGFSAALFVFAANEALMYEGWVDYAPLLSRAMYDEATGKLTWWWALHFRVISYASFLAFSALLLFQLEQMEAQRRALEELSITDPLTRVSNRRRFGERLEEEVQRRNRSGRPFCVLLCDADHFKKVNDNYGHHAGDEVLKHLAAVLRDDVRANIDVVGRLGGEEFGVLLPETALAAALEVCERILVHLREHEFDIDGHRFRVTLSIGLVESLEGSGEEAMRLADANLYRAKSEGRDRVVGSAFP